MMLGVEGISKGNLAVLDKITGRDRRPASCFFRPAVGILVAAGVLPCLSTLSVGVRVISVKSVSYPGATPRFAAQDGWDLDPLAL